MRNNSYNYAYQIVCDRDWKQIQELSYNVLTDDEKSELAAKLWSEDDCDFSALSENIMLNKITKSLFSTLIIGTTDTKIELADVLRDGLIDYYSTKSSELIDRAIIDYIDEDYTSKGFVKRSFADNGETYWSKQYA